VFAWIIDNNNKDNIFYNMRHDFGDSKHTLKRKAQAKGREWRTVAIYPYSDATLNILHKEVL